MVMGLASAGLAPPIPKLVRTLRHASSHLSPLPGERLAPVTSVVFWACKCGPGTRFKQFSGRLEAHMYFCVARNNDNLGRLSCKIVSPLIFAHVRAAYPGMPVSEQNCHPFQWGRYLWMHNGVVGGFMKIRRKLLACLSDEAYDTVQSFHSDSAISFAIFLHHLPHLHKPQSPQVLLTAMQVLVIPLSFPSICCSSLPEAGKGWASGQRMQNVLQCPL